MKNIRQFKRIKLSISSRKFEIRLPSDFESLGIYENNNGMFLYGYCDPGGNYPVKVRKFETCFSGEDIDIEDKTLIGVLKNHDLLVFECVEKTGNGSKIPESWMDAIYRHWDANTSPKDKCRALGLDWDYANKVLEEEENAKVSLFDYNNKIDENLINDISKSLDRLKEGRMRCRPEINRFKDNLEEILIKLP